MYLNPSTHDQSLMPEYLPRKKNSPFPFYSDSEHGVGQVSGNTLDREPERDWRDTPPLDRLLANLLMGHEQKQASLSQFMEDEEVSAENLGDAPLRE